jgi:SAM-dependent methyltransferase
VRTILFDLLERIVATSPPQPVIEFGSLRVPTQTHLPSVRSVFAGYQYSGADMMRGVGVDQLQDLRQIGLRDGSVGTALLLDTLEHVEDPRQAMTELQRCLAPNGVLLLTSHFYFPKHAYPYDYWRFTSDGILALLKNFPRRYADEGGLRLFPHTVVGLAGGAELEPEKWEACVKAVKGWLKHGATSWKERMLNLFPPAMAEVAYERYAKMERPR